MNYAHEHKRRSFLHTWAKFFAVLVLIAIGMSLLFAGAGAYMTWLAANDAKLMALYDRQHGAKVAKHCGNSGALVRDSLTNSTLCMYVNKDGQAMYVAVPNAPLVASRGVR